MLPHHRQWSVNRINKRRCIMTADMSRLVFLRGLRITLKGEAVTDFACAKVPAPLAYLAVTGQPHS